MAKCGAVKARSAEAGAGRGAAGHRAVGAGLPPLGFQLVQLSQPARMCMSCFQGWQRGAEGSLQAAAAAPPRRAPPARASSPLQDDLLARLLDLASDDELVQDAVHLLKLLLHV